uniref:BED-type domain-containing protein n=1 Tax=Hucho hucho TaxID=62062 RepID=A0A4W5RVE7_9TELE
MDAGTLATSFHVWQYRQHFIFKELREKNMTVQCVLCKPKIRMLSTSKNSTSNLKKHLERKHATMYLKLPKGQMDGPNGSPTESPKEPRYKKSKLENLINQMTSQPKVNTLVFNFMVENVQSLSVLEQPAFRKLIEGLSGGKMSMTRNTFINGIMIAYSKMKEELKEQLDSVQSVCTTADIWSAHNRSYIGMTCHWIEKNELERKSAALACARIRGSHTFDTIAAKIHEIHLAYNIENKLQATVTDNGSNFVKVFKEFSKGDNENYEDDIVEFQDVGTILDGADEAMHLFLLPHQRCASHALNLIASHDLAQVLSQGENAQVYCSAMAKCFAIWNSAHQSPLAISAVEDIEKMKLTAPCVSRWISEYSAVEKMVSLPETKLMDVCDSFGVPRLLSYEIAFLKEYINVFKPLAFALELFQGEQCFLGLVIPTVLTLKKKLCEKKTLALYLFDVINPVLEAIDSRFKQLFASLEAKMATATTPQFRLWWLPEAEREDMHLMLVAEATRLETTDGAPIGSDNVQSEDEFFSFGPGTGNSDTEEEVRRYLEGTSKNLSCLKYFQRVRKLFLKFNAILPSSALVERLFSHNGNILTPKRNGLTDDQFEQVLLLRYNSKICTLDKLFPE